MSELTHYKELGTPPDHLGAFAFKPGEKKVGTIKLVRTEQVVGRDGRAGACVVCHFQESGLLPLVLNRKNCQAIEKLYKTPYVEQWVGKRIVLGVRKEKAFGELMDCVRVLPEMPAAAPAEPPRPEPGKPIVCTDCKNPLRPFGNMGVTQLAGYTAKQYGRVLCADCAKKAAEGGKDQYADAQSNGNQSGTDAPAQDGGDNA